MEAARANFYGECRTPRVMFSRVDRKQFAEKPDVLGSESIVHFARPLSEARYPDPVLRYRYRTEGVLGDVRPDVNVELSRFHIHRFARLIIEADPLNLRKTLNLQVTPVLQGSRPLGSEFPSSVSERVHGVHVSDARFNETLATPLYHTYRDYGFAHDFHGRNTFRNDKGRFTSIELLNVLSPEALRALSLPPISPELAERGARACAWVAALGAFSPHPLPPPQHTRRDVPLSPGSCFKVSIIDLTYFWQGLYALPLAQRRALKPYPQQQTAEWQELRRARRVFGRDSSMRGPLDVDGGSNILDFGISPKVFDSFRSYRETIRGALNRNS